MTITTKAWSARSALFESLVVAGLAALNVSLVFSFNPPLQRQGLAAVIAVLHVVPLLFRRRYLLESLAAMLAAATLFVSLGFPVAGLGVAMYVMIYWLGNSLATRRSLSVLGLTAIAMSFIAARGGVDATTVLGNLVSIFIVWALGSWHRRWKLTAQVERERAEHLSRTQEERAERAVFEERLRIARELHDVVAHAMSVVTVQAGSARLTAEKDPKNAAQTLRTIETVSREAITEMHRMLIMLRSDDVSDPLSPSPGLADLDSLVATAVSTGLSVELVRDGPATTLGPGADLAAFRVLQEALTNVRKHARATRVQVRVDSAPDGINLQVIDNGLGRSDGTTPGHGIVGMRERAALYGGRLEAESLPDGGFRVALWLPVDKEYQ